MSASAIRACCVAIAVALIAGCATRPESPPTRELPKPCDDCVRGVANFTKVNEKLWRGSQPDRHDPAAFRALADAGVKTVINLRHDHDDFPLLRGTDVQYVWIPMRAWHPDTEDIVLFLSTLRRLSADPKSWPIFVHCAAGKDRTGYSIAAYRIIEEGWTADDAIHEMFDFRFNEVWFRNPGYLRALAEQRDEIRERVRRSP